MLGEDGYPYGIPLNHWYNPEDGKIYFHGAKTGHKIDAIARCDKVSYCVWDAGYRKEGEWALNVNSVIVFGRISLVTDEEKAIDPKAIDHDRSELLSPTIQNEKHKMKMTKLLKQK